MMTRRDLLSALGATVALSSSSNLWSTLHHAWEKPIGLETFTVRDAFARDPVRTLEQVAAIGYKEIEFIPTIKPALLKSCLRNTGLTAPSAYLDAPQTLDGWKKIVENAKEYEVRYAIVGDNPRLDSEAWKRRAEFYNQCGTVAQDAGMQFCYHAHYNEYANVDGTSGYDIMLTRCDARLLKMEMDLFWATYAGADPLQYWRRYPGRFPLLHIKDLSRNVVVNPHEDPTPNGPNPFAPVGMGKIDWARIFAHVGEAGTKHIFVEQDRCDMPPMEAIKISFDYLKTLRVSV